MAGSSCSQIPEGFPTKILRTLFVLPLPKERCINACFLRCEKDLRERLGLGYLVRLVDAGEGWYALQLLVWPTGPGGPDPFKSPFVKGTMRVIWNLLCNWQYGIAKSSRGQPVTTVMINPELF